MASKPPTDTTEASSTEGNIELKEDKMQTDILSVPGPSSVSAEDVSKTIKSCAADTPQEISKLRESQVNIVLGHGSVINDLESLVLNKVQGIGSVTLITQESFTDPADLIKAAHEAANTAREAAASCRKTTSDASTVLNISNERIASYGKKAKATARSHDAIAYHSRAGTCCTANERLSRLAQKAESVANLADSAACEADSSATALAEVSGTRSEVVRDRQQLATSAANSAKIVAVDAYKAKYRLLEAMKDCWEAIDSGVIPRTESTDSSLMGKKCMKRAVVMFGALMLITGCAFLVIPHVLNLSDQGHIVLTCLGILQLLIALGIFIFKVLRYIYKRRKAAERNSRREIVNSIQESLSILDNYFENNGVIVTPSQSPSRAGQ